MLKICIQILYIFELVVKPQYFKLLIDHPDFEAMLRVVFIRSDNQWVRFSFSNFLQEIFSNPYNYDADEKQEFRSKLLQFLCFDVREEVSQVEYNNRLDKYYEVLYFCIQNAKPEQLEGQLDFKKVLDEFIEQLYQANG